jgi:hypothetical protein
MSIRTLHVKKSRRHSRPYTAIAKKRHEKKRTRDDDSPPGPPKCDENSILPEASGSKGNSDALEQVQGAPTYGLGPLQRRPATTSVAVSHHRYHYHNFAVRLLKTTAQPQLVCWLESLLARELPNRLETPRLGRFSEYFVLSR